MWEHRWKQKEPIVRYPGQDAPRGGWADPPRVGAASPRADVANFIGKTLVIVELEMRRLRHDPTGWITRTFQPLLWLVVFGQVFARTRAFATGDLPYIAFLAPGIIAQAALFGATLFGSAIIWERDLGIVHKFMASPIPRTAFILGKALAAGVRCLPQVCLIYVVSLFMGVQVRWNPLAVVGVLSVVMLGAALFCSVAMSLACVVKTRERYAGLSQFLTMPLFLASNAIYPLSIMPGWLHLVSRINPVTYLVDALRALMLVGAASAYGVGFDLGVLVVMTVVLVILAGRLCPRLVT
jgi:ABC-2 type transport system permease protein